MSTSLIETAARIGTRIAESAAWDGPACTWVVAVPDLSAPVRAPRTVQSVAGPSIYQGTSGIALFLSELYGVTGDELILRTAIGALTYARDKAHTIPVTNFGFHSGRVGIAWVMARLAHITGDEAYYDHAREMLSPIFGNESRDAGRDVIAGAAGAIPVLLDLADTLQRPEARDSAVALANLLARVARKNVIGWSWPTKAVRTAMDLTGFAHGAAGYGAAFMELHGATGEAWYRFAAEQAFAYEDSFFDETINNWPDFRYHEMSENFKNGVLTDAFRQRIRRGVPIPKYVLAGMHGWCHGAPGIGLSRLRAFELLGDDKYSKTALAAVVSTANALRPATDNFSLCHGVAGNCETLIMATQVLGQTQWLDQARAAAIFGVAQYESRDLPWPGGTRGTEAGAGDPSLLVGTAGIGHFLLRLIHPDIPSVLFRIAKSATPQPHSSGYQFADPTVRSLRREHINAFFGRSMERMEALAPDESDFTDRLLARTDGTDVPTAHRALCELRDRHDGTPLGNVLADAFRLDDVRFGRTVSLNDAFHIELTRLLREPEDRVDWANCVFALAPTVELVSTAFAWDAWEPGPIASIPDADPYTQTFLLDEHEGSIRGRKLGTMAAMVLESVQGQTTLAALVETVRAILLNFDTPASAAELNPIVLDALQAAYRDGAIQIQGVNVPPPAA